MKKKWILAAFLLMISFGLIGVDFNVDSENSGGRSHSAQIIDETQETEFEKKLELELGDGRIIELTHGQDSFVTEKNYQRGDKVMVIEYPETEQYESYYIIQDYDRRSQLWILFACFATLLILINRTKGVLSLLSLGFSFLVIFKLLIPLLLAGLNPLACTFLAMLLLVPAQFYLSHGINSKSTIAMLGTLLSLAATSLLAIFFTRFTLLSGLASEETAFLKTGLYENLDFKGLLLAGIIISLLGVLDDVSITQASVVQELKKSKKEWGWREVYGRAMNVGRDHISSVVNTLILVYAGASLPLLILLMTAPESLGMTLNLEFLAEELVRTLVGSMGLILTVPITSFIAAKFPNSE